MSSIEFTVNGTKCSVTANIPRDTSLNSYIRYALALPGTKAMCHEGGCGACVVSVRARRQTSGQVETFSVNSCLVLVFSCQGWEITTIEGLGSRLVGYSDIQKRVAAFNATQCGYCTPGWVMHLHSLRDKNLTMEELERSFGSNTCRCTGFRPILDTVKSFAVDASPQLCEKVQDIEDMYQCNSANDICHRKCSLESDDSDWCIVNKLMLKEPNPIVLDFGDTKFFKVYTVDEIFEIIKQYNEDYMLIDGNTGKGIYENFEYPSVLIDISDVSSLKKHVFEQNLVLGANMSLEDTMKLFKNTATNRRDDFGYLAEFAKHFELIAHIPVRKIGSLAGNLMIKHQIPTYQSDVFLLFTSVGATITIRNGKGVKKSLNMIEFLNYDMRGQLMLNIELPPLSEMHIFRSFKIMPRSQNALSIVNAAFLIEDPRSIQDISIVYGNISAKFNHATQTESFLKGKNIFDNGTIQKAIKILYEEIVPIHLPPKESPGCRRKLAIGLFYKFILNISPAGIVPSRFRSGGKPIARPLSKGTQDYQTNKALYPLNQPVAKYEGLIQSSGEARYANDIPPMTTEVYAAFVLSTVFNGEVQEISKDVLDIKGVISIYTAKDIPGLNSFTVPGLLLETEDEEILASKDIKFYGQPIAIVVAESEKLAANVAKKVKVTYKNVPASKPIITIDQAKKDTKRLRPYKGLEPAGRGTDVNKVIKGVYEIYSQYHYYLEPLSTVVVPVDDLLEVYDSTQWVDITQFAIARSLGIKESAVVVKVRRLGGAFGGKLSRNVQVATACALVAKKLDRPCRFIMPLQSNLTVTGKRLPCQVEYEVGVNNAGKIQYLDAILIEDDGCSNNENIVPFTTMGLPHCYKKDYFSVKAAAVLTDLPSNTYVRAPSTLEAISSMEHIMEHIAFTVQKDPTEVRLTNMTTEDNDLPILIQNLKKECDYDKRAKDIEQFNKANRWMKKAIKISVMRFPLRFFGNYTSMVTIYQGDGTVTVTTGGIEMGQGLNTKAAQVCAYELGIPLESITVLPNHSFTAANNVYSGSSTTSEAVCYSVIKSCEILNRRLEPIREKMVEPTWLELIKKAAQEQVNLTATYKRTENEIDSNNYSSFGVAALEVQLDVLTGRYEILRVDILEDVGLSANPNIDIGQVEGAYIQGLGYFTTEKIVFDQTTGKLLTNRSLTYHVPLALDIPADFRVKLRYNSKNPKGVLGSKAVGEMGVCLAHGITHALRQCIMESRIESGYDPTEWINIDIPYDTESILKALNVKLEEMILK